MQLMQMNAPKWQGREDKQGWGVGGRGENIYWAPRLVCGILLEFSEYCGQQGRQTAQVWTLALQKFCHYLSDSGQVTYFSSGPQAPHL